MRTKGKHILNSKWWIASIMLVIFGWYYSNAVLFSHSHIINGVTIVHSHVYWGDHTNGSQDGESQHTSSQLTLINALGVYYAETPTEYAPLVVEYIELQRLKVRDVVNIYDNVILDIQSRGPPSQSNCC